MPTEETYRTKNLFEAGYLNLTYIPSLEKSTGGDYFFVFPAEAKNLSTQYWSGKVDINLKQFVDSVKTLKDRLSAR